MKKIKKITVKSCKSCVFSQFDFTMGFDGHATCLAPTSIHKGNYIINSYYKNYKSPKWCPLKENKLIIEHK